MTSRKVDTDSASDRGPSWRVEGLPEGEKSPDQGPPQRRLPGGRWIWALVLGLLVVNWIVSSILLGPEQPVHVPYTFFVEQLQASNVESVVSTGDSIQGVFKTEVTVPDNGSAKATSFETERPTFAQDDLLKELTDQGVVVNAEPPNQPAPLWQQILLGFGPTLLLVWIFYSIYRRSIGGLGGIGGIGKSSARLFDASGTRTTFADVAGIDDAKEELVEVVEFLRHPDRFTRLGAAIPRGVLLTGQPGTGKTLLARAVAGEANVPFFSVSASEFIEMIVGVGASRVRDLFEQAKKASPAIIFIDEIDSIGRSRGAAMSFGGHDEREQTLNQILTEMDGFDPNEGVIVIAATNRPDVLDSALLRPGRFDRQVVVSPPDQVGRRAILQVHTRDVPLASDVDLGAVASSTPGMVGADLENLANEAALTAARRGHEAVHAEDFSDALEKVVLGTERRIVLTPEERERTAYHESGHALLGMLQPGADPVRKVSIIPRGKALGVTFQSPETDRYAYSEEYLRGKIIGALGGRAAEDVVFGETTTGAESDLVQVTSIARRMVGRWGMSPEIGPLTVLDEESSSYPFRLDGVAPETLELVDREARRIVDECYRTAVDTLRQHRQQLNALATALLDKETLEAGQAYEIAGLPQPAESP